MEPLWTPLLGLCYLLAAATADRHTVFWNSSNPRFQSKDYTVYVQLNDYLDIVCPHYEDEAAASGRPLERYTLFLVEREDYVLCHPSSRDQVRWQCSHPTARHGPEKLSEKFQRFTPFTLGKEFKEGHSYYYISEPLHETLEAPCLKLKVTVSDRTSHNPPLDAETKKEPGLPADDPDAQVLHSVGHSAAPRPCPLAWSMLLLPLILLQTP
ncbi:ephrin-A1 [Ornithorhynchus anatinus]|uniref:Ephrin-A1 n=1 Tax=Ornithorhynchus anatinus TaxID=9258 RepID=F6RY19_ORNAN|nr:ephrin-A1 [Ornithorhynchus anatinus]